MNRSGDIRRPGPGPGAVAPPAQPNADTISICDLEVFFRVGVPKAERARPQRLLVSVDMARDFANAAAADDLHATIDYHAVARRIQQFGQGRSWQLIETLAVEIAETILREFHAPAVTVEVKKFALPEARHVSVRTRRQRSARPAR